MSEAGQSAEERLAVLQWAEKNADGALKQLLESRGLIHAQATTLITVLLAGLGGALSLAAKVLDAPKDLAAWGAMACVAYLSLLVVAVVRWNLWAEKTPLAFGDPQHLAQTDYSLAALLEEELKNRQAAIDCLRDANARRSKSLNRLRMAAAALPLVFVAAAGLAALLRR